MFTKHRDLFIFICMLIIVPLAGELQIHPLHGDFENFRVSFGSPLFLLFLLWLRRVPMLVSGLCTGAAVVLFRAMLDIFGGMSSGSALYLHSPAFFYYFVYALCFSALRFHDAPLTAQAMKIAGYAIGAEVIASIAELYSMNFFMGTQPVHLSLPVLAHLTGIAFLRCFFILSFFFLSQLYITELHLAQESREKNRLTMLIAGLYEEVFELQKTLHNAETATHDCYGIYEELRSLHHKEDLPRITQNVLRTAGEVHEIKKDTQRIYAGLSELTNNHRLSDYLPAAELCHLIIHTQKKYARRLDKNITFLSEPADELPDLHVYTMLSILNNLAGNAVEAIHQKGTITITMKRSAEENLCLTVENTGSSIPLRRLGQIFRPGYTTKYDSSGRASSGVGLTYVKALTESLGGTITAASDGKSQVQFKLRIPLAKIMPQNETASPAAANHAPLRQ